MYMCVFIYIYILKNIYISIHITTRRLFLKAYSEVVFIILQDSILQYLAKGKQDNRKDL